MIDNLKLCSLPDGYEPITEAQRQEWRRLIVTALGVPESYFGFPVRVDSDAPKNAILVVGKDNQILGSIVNVGAGPMG